MAAECLDLTSDTEVEPPRLSAPRAKKTEVVSLLSDSEDGVSPQKPVSQVAGAKRKRAETLPQQQHYTDTQPVSASRPVQPVQDASTSKATTHAAASVAAADPFAIDEDDDDDDLRVELAFTKKPKTSTVHPTESPAVAKSDSPALGSHQANDTFARASQPDWSLPGPSSQGADDNEIYDVPDDEPYTGTGKAKSSKKKRKQDSPDYDSTQLTKEEKKEKAAQERQRQKFEEKERKEQEKEQKRLQKEQDKAAKLAAKEEVKQARDRDKMENRASKGFYALQEIQAVLDTQLVAHPLGSQIMEKLRKHAGKTTSPCQGIKFEIQPNPMKPIKSVLWQRSSVVEPGADAAVSQAETVPYVLLYFTAEEFLKEIEKDNFQSVMQQCAEVHPDHTLGLLVDRFEAYVHNLECKGFRDNVRNTQSSAGAYRPDKPKKFLADLAVRWPGVRHRLAIDANQAAEHVVNLTTALAMQPYKAQESWLYSFGGTKESAAFKSMVVEKPLAHKEREGWFSALVHVNSVPPGAAHGIVSQFPSMGALMAFCLDTSRDYRAKQRILEDLLQPSGRRVGPMAAKKLLGLLLAEDPQIPMEDFASDDMMRTPALT